MVCGLPKIGKKPNVEWSQGSMWRWTNGASTITPQNPSTTLGIAASISTSGPTIARTALGASIAR